MKLNSLFIRALLVACLFLFACKKTVEGESQNWESNSARVMKLKQRYPQFQAPIDEQFNIAKAKWDEAQSISGEEQKIAAMSAANGLIYSSFITSLDDMDSKKSQMRDLQQKLRNLRGPQEVSYRASSSISECDQAISMIDMTLGRGATTVNEAESVLTILKNSVDNSIKHSNDVITYANDLERKKQEEEKKAQTNNGTNNTNTSTSTENSTTTTPAAVTCKYCGTSNTGGTTCSGCKAPL
jgi:hypothetical protein